MEDDLEPEIDHLVEPLTPRERDVLLLLVQHLRYQDIADRLTMAVSSVKWYVQQIYGKLGVDNRRDAIQRAEKLGLLETHSSFPNFSNGEVDKLPTGIVTFLFTNIEGSALIWEQIPQAMQPAILQYHSIIRQAVEANSGQVFQVDGEDLQAAFQLTSDGLYAALTAQRALRTASWGPSGPLKVRMGLHTGPAKIDITPGFNRANPYSVSHTLSRAIRIASAGYGGQILLSQDSANLVERELPDEVGLKDLGKHLFEGTSQLEHLYQVLVEDLPQEFPPLASGVGHPNNLPVQLSSFIGRKKEIEAVCSLLKVHRLVTLTGSGGTGKTRLALKVADTVLGDFTDGVFMIELALLSDPEMIPQAIEKMLGLQENPGVSVQMRIVNFLKNRHALLLLDNCEHLLPTCAVFVDGLLKACPTLVILATSRISLEVKGERPYRVPPLSIPDLNNKLNLPDYLQFKSVDLFRARAEEVLAGFTLTAADMGAVIQICQRLDGIPLAIELAAARVQMMTIEQIALRLDDAFHLLTNGGRAVINRQKTLKASIEWSYQLLSEDEKVLLQRLSVFSGGWTLEAAEEICSIEGLDSIQILDLLAELVLQSLVIMETNVSGHSRYRLHETLKQYGREKLLETDKENAIRKAHLGYYLRLVLQSEPYLRSKDQIVWLDQLEEELGNIRLALEWSLTGSVVAGMQLASALFWFWHIRGLAAEGVQWAKKLLAEDIHSSGWGEAENVTGELFAHFLARARVLRVGCLRIMYVRESSSNQEFTMLEESVAICRKLGALATRDLAFSLLMWGTSKSDFDQAADLLQESHDLALQVNDIFLIAESLLNIAVLTIEKGELRKAYLKVEESLEYHRRGGDQVGIGICLDFIGYLACCLGDYQKSLTALLESEAKFRTVGNKLGRASAMIDITRLLLSKGDFQEASRWGEEALSLAREADLKGFILGSLCNLGRLAWEEGNYTLALKWGEEALLLSRQADLGTCSAYHLLGRIALSSGDLDLAVNYCHQMISGNAPAIWPEMGIISPPDTAYQLETLGVLAAAMGQMKRAVIVFSAIQNWETQIAGIYGPRERNEHQAAFAAARQSLGDEAFSVAWQDGQSMALDEAKEKAYF